MRKFPHLVAAIATAAMASTACAAESDQYYSAPSVQINGSAPPLPTLSNLPKPVVAELNSTLRMILDPAVDPTLKIARLQDADRDPQLPTMLVEAATAKNVTIVVTATEEPEFGRLRTTADVTLSGVSEPGATVDFVAGKQQWQVGREFTCLVIRTAGMATAACQDN